MRSRPHEAGWSDAYDAFLRDRAPGPLPAPLGRISSEHRGGYMVLTSEGELLGQAPKGLRRVLAERGDEKPVVGDWVGYEPVAGGTVAVRSVLPRRTSLRRKRPHGEAEQVLVANVDVVLVVTSVGRDLNERRLERYLAVVREGGAAPVVVVTKTDLAGDTESDRARLAVIVGDAPVLFTSVREGRGLDAVGALATPGTTLAMLGSSGVGKSTLANALAGATVLAVGELDAEGKGRHTTTRRQLVLLPGGAALIDTPGLRELGLVDAGRGLESTFADVEAAVAACRFADCGHGTEPDCGVRAALASGALTEERYASYQKLAAEVAAATRGEHETRARGRAGSRLVRARLRDKGRR